MREPDRPGAAAGRGSPFMRHWPTCGSSLALVSRPERVLRENLGRGIFWPGSLDEFVSRRAGRGWPGRSVAMDKYPPAPRRELQERQRNLIVPSSDPPWATGRTWSAVRSWLACHGRAIAGTHPAERRDMLSDQSLATTALCLRSAGACPSARELRASATSPSPYSECCGPDPSGPQPC